MPTLHLVRGIPGSGKSTYAKKLAAALGCKHYETDQYFINPETGRYEYDAKKIHVAHEWCRQACLDELLHQRDVVVANTFIVPEHIRPYMEDADPLINGFLGIINFPVVIYEMTGQFGNIHAVPLNTISKMMSHWVSNAELAKLDWRNPVTFKTVNP